MSMKSFDKFCEKMILANQAAKRKYLMSGRNSFAHISWCSRLSFMQSLPHCALC